MDIESVFLRAMFQATDDWILRGGPEPNDKAILALAPELAGFIAAANEPEDDEEDGMEWIPVRERLPEVHVTVLAVTRAFPQDIRLAQMASHDGVMWRFCDMDDDDVDSFGITHWMPLPAPPETSK